MRVLVLLAVMGVDVVVVSLSIHPLALALAAVSLFAAALALGHPSAGVCRAAHSRPGGTAVPEEAQPAGPVGGGHRPRGAHA